MSPPERDFETEFWDIIVAHAERDPIVRRWAAKIALEEELGIGFSGVPAMMYASMYNNFGLGPERTDQVIELSKGRIKEQSNGQA